ncbi:MAG: outer membrane lipoprotein-sorting protein [Deltaproteobacteria bacterium]|nr:outer membrane lipoprotein-sorting protein [Deltaproteobacteria bacterium]
MLVRLIVVVTCLTLGYQPTLAWAQNPSRDGRTWKTVAELSPQERERIDLSTDTPRHSQFPYLPAEPYPFAPPYTAEEMGFRSMEFPHQPRWSCVYADAGATIDHWGHLIVQSKTVGLVAYHGTEGLKTEIYDTAPGDSFVTSLSQDIAPAEKYGNQSLFSRYRTDKTFTKKIDMFVYTNGLRRVRRQPQPRRSDRFPNQAFTFDDTFGRDAWEWSWRIIGTDVLHQTLRFPKMRKSITLTDANGQLHDTPVSEIRPMGKGYTGYTADGGVPCYVVEAKVREDWLPGYYAPRILYWLDQQAFYPLRIEEYDREGKLIFIETRVAEFRNPALKEQGYGMQMDLYWDVTTDLMTYSTHDGHQLREWTDDDRKSYFNPDFLRRVWFIGGVKSQADVSTPEEFFLRPALLEGRFPDERNIELPADLRARINAQEKAGQLVFSEERVDR